MLLLLPLLGVRVYMLLLLRDLPKALDYRCCRHGCHVSTCTVVVLAIHAAMMLFASLALSTAMVVYGVIVIHHPRRCLCG